MRTVKVFGFGGRQLGSEVSDHVAENVVAVTREEDFGHDVAFIAAILEVLFGTGVVKTIGSWASGVVQQSAVAADYL